MRLAKVAYVPVEKRAQICSVVKNASVALARDRALGVVMRVVVHDVAGMCNIRVAVNEIAGMCNIRVVIDNVPGLYYTSR